MRKAGLPAPLVLASAVVFGLASCSEATAPPLALGRLIARESLTTADGNELPCCTVTTPGDRVTLVGGALSEYALAQYTDTVWTPAGARSGACVQEIPNGGVVQINGLVTLPDGSSYLLLGCSVGTYRLTLTEQLVHPDGSSETRDTLLTSGSFTWQRDRLTLLASDGGPATASLSAATVAVTVPGHRYQFVATRIR